MRKDIFHDDSKATIVLLFSIRTFKIINSLFNMRNFSKEKHFSAKDKNKGESCSSIKPSISAMKLGKYL